MSHSLTTLLGVHELPLPELQAAVLDGDVFRLDERFCSIAEVDSTWQRATALSGRFSDTHTVCRWSAAWVWGATGASPTIHEAFTLRGGGGWEAASGIRLRSAQLAPDDAVDFGSVKVTSVTRTITDLVRSETYTPETAVLVTRLSKMYAISRKACDDILDRRRNLPHKGRARRRLDAAGLSSAASLRAAAVQPPLTR